LAANGLNQPSAAASEGNRDELQFDTRWAQKLVHHSNKDQQPNHLRTTSNYKGWDQRGEDRFFGKRKSNYLDLWNVALPSTRDAVHNT
jgi:hypothetical protein